MCEAVTVKPGLQYRLKDVKDARTGRHPLRWHVMELSQKKNYMYLRQHIGMRLSREREILHLFV